METYLNTTSTQREIADLLSRILQTSFGYVTIPCYAVDSIVKMAALIGVNIEVVTFLNEYWAKVA